MIVLSAEEAGGALKVGPLLTRVTGVSTDTRTLKPGDLFVALRGERFDGHDYVEVALEAGACGVVVDRRVWEARAVAGREVPEGAPSDAFAGAAIYPVDDTLVALGALARCVRRKSAVLVLAVTGSAGKTSTKDILGAMVARTRKVVTTAANQNNEIGVPLTLLQIEPDTQAVVVEMGMRGRGQIATLAAVAEPDIGVVTNVYPVHLELLGSLENIAQAKAELIEGLRPGGVGVAPATCEPLEPCLAASDRRVVRFAVAGRSSCADELADVVGRLEQDEVADVETVHVRWPGGEMRLEIPAVPRHTVENLVAAAAACYAAGLPVERCLPGFLDSGWGKGRGEVIHLPGLCVIDDTYNANPAAVQAAIDNLVRVAARLGGRPVAVLGDMWELGPEERLYHRRSGEYAAAAGVKLLWGVGSLSESTTEGFLASGGEAGHVPSPAETSPVAASLSTGDVVLFKASRAVGLELMVGAVAEQARAGRWAAEAGGSSARATSEGSGPSE